MVVIVHKNARFRTRKPDNTPSALKSIRPFGKQALLLFLEMKPILCQKMNDDMKMNLICKFIVSAFMSITRVGGRRELTLMYVPFSPAHSAGMLQVENGNDTDGI